MSILIPHIIKQFSLTCLSHITSQRRNLLTLYLTSLLHTGGKKSFTALSKNVLCMQRVKTAPGKFFSRKHFRSRYYHRTLLEIEINNALKVVKNVDKWFLLIDGTSTRRGGFTKIENALQYKEKHKKKKKSKKNSGRSTKAHTFLMGVLIAPDGRRIPFTRYTYYTEAYCKKHNKQYIKQTDLALLMIKELRSYLPPEIQPIVVADSFFDYHKIFKYCQKKNIAFITPAKSTRNYITKHNCKKKLHLKGKHKKKEVYKNFEYVKGQEPLTRLHNRYANENSKIKTKHSYRVTQEELDVSGLGNINVVFSFKHQKKRKQTFCVLLCCELSFSAEQIVEFYALRWQVEVFFRELKSELGLGDYSGSDFKSYERYIDFLLIAYIFLEFFRSEKIKSSKSKKERGKFNVMRVRNLISHFRIGAMKENVDFLEEHKLSYENIKI